MPQWRERQRRDAKRAAFAEPKYAQSLERMRRELQDEGVVYEYDGYAMRLSVPMALTEEEFAYGGWGAVLADLVESGGVELITYHTPDGRTILRWAARRDGD